VIGPGRGDDAARWIFFDDAEAAIVEAVAARVIPSEPGSPGAREAGVVVYIDRSLDDAYPELATLYRTGVAQLDRYCRERHATGFAQAAEEVQDALLAEIDASDGPYVLARLFAVIREHTIQGMFCDPQYGGNRDMVGWRLVGFPGAQWAYTAEQMRPGFDAREIPRRTLADLRREHPIAAEE
jgi:gluconate 2-dehydrogenase gamma chain